MVRWRITGTAFLALLLLGALQSAGAQGFSPAPQSTSTNVLNFVKTAFSDTQSSGSLVLRAATCRENGDLLPDELSDPPAGPFHNLDEALTSLSRVDPRVSWSRGPNGLVRVRDGRVQSDLLRVHIRRVQFRDRADALLAVQDVLSAPEVRSYIREHHVEKGMFFAAGGGLLPGPGSTKGAPKLSGTLRNVTVAEALDHIATFFHTLWVYGECGQGAHRRVVITAY